VFSFPHFSPNFQTHVLQLDDATLAWSVICKRRAGGNRELRNNREGSYDFIKKKGE
jgi:hypothetical protein